MSIYTKKVSVGAFIQKGIDIKDKDLITITNEGVQVPGQFGVQNVFMVKLTNGKEKNLAFNQTSLNNCIDAFGADAKNWIGKQVKVWIIKMSVQGKIRDVIFVAHPEAVIDENGQFNIANPTISNPIISNPNKEINPEDIPF